MNYIEAKRELRQIGEEIASILQTSSNQSTLADLGAWKTDLETDVFSVVVVGQFNRGKSTLLNALFGFAVLPVGITPTTAVVTILRFSESEEIQVHYLNGQVQSIQYTPDALMALTAESPSAASAIDYVEIGIPHPLLRSGIVYVDTPGVSDLNRERTEVTYRFVPRADAVLFVLDSTQAVTMSEIDFLQSVILDAGVARLLFVSNFSDLLESEDRVVARTKTQDRIASAIDAIDPTVVLVSALQGCSPQSRAQSGIEQLIAELTKISLSGPRSLEKASRMRDRLKAIASSAKADLERVKSTSQLDTEELAKKNAAVEEQWHSREAKVARIGEWVDDRKVEIFAMTQKSLDTFFKSLLEDVNDSITSYAGPDFKTFVEVQIPIQVKKRCKAWVEGHGDALRMLIMRLSSELTEGLSREFKTNLPLLEPSFVSKGMTVEEFQAGSPEANKGRFHAGLIIGGVGALLVVVGLPFVAPMLSLAAFPWLSSQLDKSNLEKAKQKLMPELDKAFYAAAKSMRNNVLGYLDAEIKGLQASAELKYRQLLDSARADMKREQGVRSQETALARSPISVFQEAIEHLDNLELRLSSMFPKLLKGDSI
jgi:predicted GTPase